MHPAIGLKTATGKSPGSTAVQFGGDPTLPAALVWPEDAGGLPMHHLMQVDCNALPATDPDFPREGTLFFFVTGSWAPRNAPSLGHDPHASAILYWPEPTSHLPTRAHPDNTPQLGDDSIVKEPVRSTFTPSKPGLVARLLGKDVARASPRQFANVIEPVPLEAVAFDSHPGADEAANYAALGPDGSGRDPHDYGFRPHQILGYAPTVSDMNALDLEGYMEASLEKELVGYDRADETCGDEEAVLLLQLSSHEAWNLDLGGYQYALQFRIKRFDLRARKFEAHWATQQKLMLSGRHFLPDPAPNMTFPDASEMKPAIALKPLVPGEAAVSPSNAFCGLPHLPEGMDWPRTKQGTPLHFLMQLDCATIPRSHEDTALPHFPDTGTLFVFLDAQSYELYGDALQVLYIDGDVHDVPPREPPEDTAVLDVNESPEGCCLGVLDRPRLPEALAEFPVPRDARRYEPRLPFAPVPYTTFSMAEYTEESDAAQVETRRKALPHESGAIPGATFVIDWLPHWFARFKDLRTDYGMSAGRRDNPVRYIPDSYPWHWSDVQEALIAFFEAADRLDRHERAALQGLWSDDIEVEARTWYEEAVAQDPLTPIAVDRAKDYRDWLHRTDEAATRIGEETEDEGGAERRERLDRHYAFERLMTALAMPRLSRSLHWFLHEEGALPDVVRATGGDILRFTRSYTRLKAYNVEHQPIPHQLFPPHGAGHGPKDEVLLMQFTSGYGLRTQFADCCWLQIWINPKALSERRFDACRAEILW